MHNIIIGNTYIYKTNNTSTLLYDNTQVKIIKKAKNLDDDRNMYVAELFDGKKLNVFESDLVKPTLERLFLDEVANRISNGGSR